MPRWISSLVAAASLGAIWSSSSPDFGKDAVLDRFGQIEPVVMVTADAYEFKGRVNDCLARAEELARDISSIKHIVVIPFVSKNPAVSLSRDHSLYSEIVSRPGQEYFEQLPFDHPVYIMYSSGTTGLPKCMVQGPGVLLNHLKELTLHTDLRREDVIFYFTTCGWMMWNWLVSSLAVGATLVLFDGNPFHPTPGVLFDLAQKEGITVFGTSAKYLSALEAAGVVPQKEFDLSRLRTILSTGSPLSRESYRYVYDQIKADVQLSSISGGTDLNGCFALGNPVLPELLGFGDGSEAVGCGRGCLIYDSPIYLKDGSIKMLGEVEIGEDVFTNDGSYQTVIGKAKYPINETLLNIKSFYGDWRGITLTKDHKVLVEKHKKVDNYEKWAESTKKSRRKYMEPTGELTWMPASQVEVGDWVFQSFPKVDIEENFVFDLAKTCFGNKKNGSKNNADDNFIINKYKSKTSLRNRFIDLDEIFAVILGLFTGDGWLYSNKPNQVGFACHSDEREVRDFIKDFFEEQGSNVRIEENKQGKNVDVIEVDNFNLTSLFYELFPNYRYTSDTKHVPKCIMNASEKIIQAYLHGYFLSDGSEQKSKIKFETTSYVLANQIRFLLLRLRLPSSLGYSDREDSREAFKNRKPSYSILCPLDDRIASQNIKEKHVWRELKDGILVQVREVNEVKNISEVFDIQVENNSNYLTSSFLVHNSAVGSLICYCLGITDVDPILHDLLFSRFLSPARGGKTIKYLYDCPLIPKVD
jgi:intein/homing endonuclease